MALPRGSSFLKAEIQKEFLCHAELVEVLNIKNIYYN